MELTVKVLEQSNMQEFDSRDQSRQGKKIKKLQLELQCGTNRFVADAFGDVRTISSKSGLQVGIGSQDTTYSMSCADVVSA